MNNNVPYKLVQDDEYQIQYYDNCATWIRKDIYDLADVSIKTVLEEVEKAIATSQYFVSESQLHSFFNDIYLEYMRNASTITEKLEADVRKVLTVPANIVLPEDNYRAEGLAEHDLQGLKDEISELEKSFIEKKTFAYMCQKELQILQGLQPLQEMVDDVLSKVDTFKQPKLKSMDAEQIEKHETLTGIFVEKFSSDRSMEEWRFKEDG